MYLKVGFFGVLLLYICNPKHTIMRRTKQVKRGLIYLAVALILSIANMALNTSQGEIENPIEASLTVAVVQ